MVRRTKPAAQQVNGSVSLPEEYAGEGEDHTAYFDVQDTVDLSVNGVPMTAPKVNGKLMLAHMYCARLIHYRCIHFLLPYRHRDLCHI